MAEPSGFAATAPGEDWISVTPSDTVDLVDAHKRNTRPRSIWVGGAGVVALVSQSGNVINFFAADGTLIPMRPKRINATSTTATGIVAIY